MPTKINYLNRTDVKEYILCAAVKRLEKRICIRGTNPYHEGTNDILDIEIGMRHHDIYQRFGDSVSKKNNAQGFYTSRGRFVDRYEGMKIAYEANQVGEEIVFVKDNPECDILFITVEKKLQIDLSDLPTKNSEIYNMLFSENLY